MDNPTLSQLQAYSTEHFTMTHPVVSGVAQQGDHVFGQQDRQLTGLGWEGTSADAAITSVGGQAKLVSATNAHLYDVVSEIHTAAQTSNQLHADVINFVQGIPKDYDVGENLTVTAKPANDPPQVQQVKRAMAAQLTTQLDAKVSAFMAHQEATRATLSAHAATVDGHAATERAAAPMGHSGPWCNREQMPGRCLPNGGTTEWPAHNPDGTNAPGAFNDGVPLDTSHAKIGSDTESPWWLREVPPAQRDWPPYGLTSAPGQPQPFLPRLKADITNPAVPVGPSLTQTTPNGTTNLLPVRPLPGMTTPSAYVTGSAPPLPNPNPFRNLGPNTPGMPAMPPVPPNGTMQQGIQDGVQHGWTPQTGDAGGGRIQMVDNNTTPPDPPEPAWQRAFDPHRAYGAPTGPNVPPTVHDGYVDVNIPDSPASPMTPGYHIQKITPGGVIAGSYLGCIGGMGGLKQFFETVDGADPGPAAWIGCLAGAPMGAAGGVMAPAFNNAWNGVPFWDAFQVDTGN